jgi:poly(3-hydroxybutyrate) depolymerase
MTFKLPIVNPGQPHKRTYISDVDGSVQYYSIVPQQPPPKPGEKPALVLSLHGASVEAISQAGAYSAKSWAHIVCPTNRRPYGFDWEDWGRIDAMDVFERAQVLLDTDRSRTYLTGHSMGGHGVWTIGSLFPDRFAAIGPSAGWLSFSSYRDTPTTAPTTVPAGISGSAAAGRSESTRAS